MSENEQPHQELLKSSEPSATVHRPRVINRKYFEPATWEPLLNTEKGQGQYGNFVALMRKRIQSKESSRDEILSFVRLVATEHNWDFMDFAIPHLPDLKEQYPHKNENTGIELLSLLYPIQNRRSFKVLQNATPPYQTYENGLSKVEEQFLRRLMFGTGTVNSPSKNRLFKSTLELAFPQPALDRLIREAKERGTDIERNYEGLPMNLRMPETGNGPGRVSSSSNNHGASTPRIVVSHTSAKSLERSSGSQSFPSSGSTLVECGDGPLPSTPNLTRTSHGELRELSNLEISEAIPDHPFEPPGIHRGSVEREEFKAYYERPSDEFLEYFQVEEPVPDPQTDNQDSSGPNSPSMPGRGPVAAGSEEIPTRSDPIEIPFRT